MILMPEEPIKQQLRRIKKKIISHLQSCDYEIIKSDNDTLCVIGARKAEWRCIKGHFRSIPLREVKRLENLPCPDVNQIKKELWLQEKDSDQFYKVFWDSKRHVWINSFKETVRFK